MKGLPIEVPCDRVQVLGPQIDSGPILLEDQLVILDDQKTVNHVVFGSGDEIQEVEQWTRIHPDVLEGSRLPAIVGLLRPLVAVLERGR